MRPARAAAARACERGRGAWGREGGGGGLRGPLLRRPGPQAPLRRIIVNLSSPVAIRAVLLPLIANRGQFLFTDRDLHGPFALDYEAWPFFVRRCSLRGPYPTILDCESWSIFVHKSSDRDSRGPFTLDRELWSIFCSPIAILVVFLPLIANCGQFLSIDRELHCLFANINSDTYLLRRQEKSESSAGSWLFWSTAAVSVSGLVRQQYSTAKEQSISNAPIFEVINSTRLHEASRT